MHICLINPPIIGERFEGYEWTNNSYTLQHIGLGYIASLLETNGHKVDIVECPGEHIDIKTLVNLLKNNDYGVIGLSVYFYNFANVLRIIKKLRKQQPSTFLFLGGYLPTLCTDLVLDKAHEIDCCVIGEGEFTCLELINLIEQKKSWRHIDGIAYKTQSSHVINSSRKYIEDLDILPFPKRVQISDKFIPITTSRGCYGQCNYCGVREFYESCNVKKMRFRSSDNVVKEIKELSHKYPNGKFLINDETFFSASKAHIEWLESFYIKIKEQNIKIKFHALARANEVIKNKEIIIKMKEIGLDNIFVGIESFSQRQLDFYQKNIKAEQNEEALNIIIENKINLSMGLMLLDPYASLKDLKISIHALKKTKCYLNIDEKQELFSIDGPVIAIPGTQLYKQLKDSNELADNMIKYEFMDPNVALYYDVVCLWENNVKALSSKFYLIIKAKEFGFKRIADKLKCSKDELFKIDLDFMEALCEAIEKRNVDRNNYHDFVLIWLQKINDITNVFKDQEKHLNYLAESKV